MDPQPASTPPPEPGREVVLPVAREELHIGTQATPTGRVTVHVIPQTHSQAIDLALTAEHVEVQRVPVNRFVDQPPPVRHEGDVTIVPVFEEVLVVEKRLRLKEEIHLIRHRTTRQHHEEIPLRTEEVQISRSPIPPVS